MKIDDYNLAKQPVELQNFKDAVTAVINQGKHQWQTVTAVPTFAGNPGEGVVYRNGTDGRLYIYLGSSWNAALFWTADAS